MRKFISLGILMLGLVFVSSTVQAQKVGYFDAEATIAKLPTVKAAKSNLEALGKKLQEQYDAKVAKFQTKYNKGLEDAQKGLLNPVQQKDLEQELAKMQQDIAQFEQKIQQDLLRKENELLEPIFAKVNQAVEDVAKENGFAYIINSNLLIYKESSGNIGPLVEKKLGL